VRPEEYLKPEIIKQVARLDLKARFIVQGLFAGLHRSPFQGFSVEFSEHRKYVPGDEPKTIDWAVLARTDRFYVKKFQAETNLTCYLAVDISRSMDYASEGITKLEYAIYLSASLGYLMINQQDSVGLALFDEKLSTYLPAESRRKHLVRLIGSLAGSRPKGTTNIAQALRELGLLVRKRGMIIVMSDFLTDPAGAFRGLCHLRYRGHEVVVFHILDPAEIRFPFSGPLRLREPETGEFIEVEPADVRKHYIERMSGFIDKFRTACFNERIDYVQMDTSISFDRALISFLLFRQHYG